MRKCGKRFATKPFFVLASVLDIIAAPTAWATPTPQFATNLTVTSVSSTDYEGAVVTINVSQPIVAGCAAATAYVVRDSTILDGSLALSTAALIAGRLIDVYVSGTCDASGNPNITQVNLH